ncbi:MAG: hypothetical protein IKM66_06770 [Clostridia bacterium]|nr:hypothetical protein [Clostridia bacterium]
MKAIPVTNAKKEYVELKLGNRTYELSLTLNAIIELQNIFGDLTSVTEKSRDLNQLLIIFRILVNDAVDNHNDDFPEDKWSHVDERYIGRKLNLTNLASLKGIIPAVFGVSLPETKNEESDETVVSDEMKELLDEIPDNDDEKNSDSGQS